MATSSFGILRCAFGTIKGAVLALAAVGALTLALGASQAEAQANRGGYAPVDPFNSFSIGIGGGIDMFRTPVDVYAYDYFSNEVDFSDILKGRGGFGTVEIGKDFRFDRLVLGIYGEYNFGRKHDSTSDSNTEYNEGCSESALAENCAMSECVLYCNSEDTLTAQATLTLRDSYAVLARLGVLAGPQTLIYGLFGYTWQKYVADVSAYSTFYNDYDWYAPFSASKSGTIGGLTFGVGAEFMVNANVSVKGEYRFVKLGAVGNVGYCSEYPVCAEAHFGPTDDHVFRGVISFKLP